MNSSTGYTVVAHVVPIELVKPANCQWGYNYNVRLAYDISFVGANAPSSMYTLQGNLHCGGQSLFFNLPNTGGSGVVTTTSNPWRGTSDCGTADINSLSCFTVKLVIQGPGINYQTSDCAFSPLPVELVSFDAELVNGRVSLNWSTASEQNSDRFAVERSPDGMQFEEIGSVPAAGHSTSFRNYTFVDSRPLIGNSYYRLRQWDRDGEQSKSHISVVHMKEELGSIKLYPNPSSGGEVQLFGVPDKSRAALYSPTGALVFESAVEDGRLNIPEMAPGIYTGFVTYATGQRSSFRYMRQ